MTDAVALQRTVARRWWLILLLCCLGAQAFTTWRAAAIGFPLEFDAALFQHAGWYMTQGARPYVDIWDIKPPFIYLTTYLLARMANGDMLTLHLLSLTVANAAVAAIILLTGILVHDLTGHPLAALLGGLVLACHTTFTAFAACGLRPRYLALALGLLALHWARQRRFFLVGLCAATSAWFYVPGAAFGLAAVAIALRQSRGWRGASTVLLGSLLPTAAAIALALIWQALPAMLAQVFLVPLTTLDWGPPVLARCRQFLQYMRSFAPVYLLGWAGIAVALIRNRRTWWLAALAAFCLGQMLLLDLDGPPDTWAAAVPAAAGVGLLVHYLRRGWLVLTAVLLLLVALSVATTSVHCGVPVVPYTASRGMPTITYMYWHKVIPPTPHYHLSRLERTWLERHSQGIPP